MHDFYLFSLTRPYISVPLRNKHSLHLRSCKTMSSRLRGTPVYQLAVKQPFDSLDHESKIYAHYLARAVWHGSRISLRETSRESPLIFDLILDLYHACEGQWDTIVTRCGLQKLKCFWSTPGHSYLIWETSLWVIFETTHSLCVDVLMLAIG